MNSNPRFHFFEVCIQFHYDHIPIHSAPSVLLSSHTYAVHSVGSILSRNVFFVLVSIGRYFLNWQPVVRQQWPIVSAQLDFV